MNDIDTLIYANSFTYHNDIEDNTFDRTHKVHDWRNYVPFVIKEMWNRLSIKERLLIMLTAESSADKEDWD